MAESLGVSRPAVREVLRALELMGIVTTVRGGANYITENMDQWLSAPLALLFQLNNSHVQQVQELRSALEQEAALLAAGNCTEKDALDLRSILAQLESSEDEKARAGLDKKLHTKIGRIAGNPMIYNVLDAAAQLTERSFPAPEPILCRNIIPLLRWMTSTEGWWKPLFPETGTRRRS